MISGVTMKINMDEYILHALKEDITSEDVSTNAVMPENRHGTADLQGGRYPLRAGSICADIYPAGSVFPL